MPPYLVGAAPSLAADWLTNPDPDLYGSWIEFAKQLFWDFQLGEAFVLATARYSTGWPARFHVVAPWLVNVEMDGGRRRYTIGGADVTDDILPHPATRFAAMRRTVTARSRPARGRLVAARLLARYATNLVAGGGLPTGVVEPSRRADRRTGGRAAVAVGGGADVVDGVAGGAVGWGDVRTLRRVLAGRIWPWSIWRRFNESRIAVLLGVPPFLVGLPSGGDSMTYCNVNAIFDYHWRAGLSPIATTCMAALSRWLLPRGTTVEVNRDEYVKPEPLVRAQTWQILVQLGVLTAEQVAEIERYSVAAPTATLTSGVLQ